MLPLPPQQGSQVKEATKGPVLCPFQGPFLHDSFVPPQDSIYDEMEDKWSRKKAEWEKNEKLEREKILLQQSEYFSLLDDKCTKKLPLSLVLTQGRQPRYRLLDGRCLEFSRK